MSGGAVPWLATLLALPWGLAVGVAYFLALRVNAALYVGGGPVWQPILLMFARMAGAVALLGALVPFGWAPVLAGLAGFGVARPLVTRWSARRIHAALADRGREG